MSDYLEELKNKIETGCFVYRQVHLGENGKLLCPYDSIEEAEKGSHLHLRETILKKGEYGPGMIQIYESENHTPLLFLVCFNSKGQAHLYWHLYNRGFTWEASNNQATAARFRGNIFSDLEALALLHRYEEENNYLFRRTSHALNA